METLLGPDAASRLINASDGAPRARIERAWARAFDSADPSRGGCPDAPEGDHNLDTNGAGALLLQQQLWPMAWRVRAQGDI